MEKVKSFGDEMRSISHRDFEEKYLGGDTRKPKYSSWVEQKVQSLFDGRKGHGGGKCTSRVLRRSQLLELLEEAYRHGRAVSEYSENNENLKDGEI